MFLTQKSGIYSIETNDEIKFLKRIRSLHKKNPEIFEKVDPKNKKRIINGLKMGSIIYYEKGDNRGYIKINKPSLGGTSYEKEIKDEKSPLKMNKVNISIDHENGIIITEGTNREKIIIDIKKDTLEVYNSTIGSKKSFSGFRDSIRDSIRGSLTSIFSNTKK